MPRALLRRWPSLQFVRVRVRTVTASWSVRKVREDRSNRRQAVIGSHSSGPGFEPWHPTGHHRSGANNRHRQGHDRWHEGCLRTIAANFVRTIRSGSEDKTVRVWDAASGKCREVIQGTGDVEAIAAGFLRFPFRALSRGLETVIEDAATAAPVARFPVPLDCISTFPGGSRLGRGERKSPVHHHARRWRRQLKAES